MKIVNYLDVTFDLNTRTFKLITNQATRSTMSTCIQTTHRTSSSRYLYLSKNDYQTYHQMKRSLNKPPHITQQHSRDQDTIISSSTNQIQEINGATTGKGTLSGSTHHTIITSPLTSEDISWIWSRNTSPGNTNSIKSSTKIMSKSATVACQT